MRSLDFLDVESYLKFAEDPNRTQDAFNIQKKFLEHPNRAAMVQWSAKATQNPDFQELYNKKYLPKFPTIEELSDMPKNSLGYELSQHLIKNNINLEFAGLDTSIFYSQDVGPLNYLAIRSTRHHDTFHVLTGLTTSPVDEYALFAFQLPQLYSPYHLTLLSTGLLHVAFYQPENMPLLMEKLNRFHQIGKNARFVYGFPFEEHWHTDINEVRSMLRVQL